MTEKFKNKNVLITGASSGIGLSTAKKAVQQGGRVILVSEREAELQKALNTLPDTGKHLAFCYDLSDVNNVKEIFEFIKGHRIKLDAMVYCAGISPKRPLKDNSAELLEYTYRINVFSFIEMTKYFQSEEYSSPGSRIVGISSVAARGGGYGQTVYGSSKAAMIAAVKLMAKELLNRDIRINCISPSCVDTPMFQKLLENSPNFSKTVKENPRAVQPLGITTPDEIADLVLFFLEQGSDNSTGREFVFDGGSSIN